LAVKEDTTVRTTSSTPKREPKISISRGQHAQEASQDVVQEE
jgi:hypothetical protein